MSRKKGVYSGSRLRLLDYFSTYAGRHNALSKNELLPLDNGSNFFHNLDLTMPEDREIYGRAWQRISQAICVINRTMSTLKIDSDIFKTEQANIRKWFSIDKRKDSTIAAGKRNKRAEQLREAAKRFEELGEILEPQIFEKEKEGFHETDNIGKVMQGKNDT